MLNRAASGLWTRQANNHSTILDYALLSEEHSNSFKSMHIDDQGFYGGDSDHHPFFVVLKEHSYVKRMFSQLKPNKTVWDIREDQDWSGFTEELSGRESSLDPTSIDSLAKSLSSVIHSATLKSIGIKMPKVKTPSKCQSLSQVYPKVYLSPMGGGGKSGSGGVGRGRAKMAVFVLKVYTRINAIATVGFRPITWPSLRHL